MLKVQADADLPGGPAALWRCAAVGGAVWKSPLAVVSVNFLAPLAADTTLADGKPLTLLLSDGADIGVPISNTYAAHAVADSAGTYGSAPPASRRVGVHS